MSASELETALKHALAKGEASNPAFRQRVYRAAVDALERTLAAQTDADPEQVADQKRRLADAIRAAEAAYQQPAEEKAEPEVATVSPEVRAERRTAAPGPEVALRAEPRPETPDAAPRRSPGDDMRIDAPERGDRQSQRRGAPFAKLLAGAVVLALIVVGVWWVITTGAFQSAEERDTSVPNPPVRLENESFEGTPDPGTSNAPARLPSGASRDEGWITLFQPADPTTLSLVGNASATIESDATSQFARIISPDAASPVVVDIPPGALQALAGRTAQFSIVARSDDNAPTQMSVTCDLAGVGDCGRLRFSVTQNDNEFLFRVDLPASASSVGAGSLSIVTDIENQGRAVKLSDVRVRELSE
ncbi:hypothetical protein [uncultured Nitratireductor sp.]|uniref:hypothetical protein n=1 Tax=uncultured Nitratireductor sp. TaxID=520953 RepID=UPI0025D96819|nr:hypothetical protein [uncultured Nitratireductor sp.]